MPPQLVALTEGPNILLDKPILLLGRHQECDILLSSRKVSRRHRCLAQVSDYLVIRDLGSTNGIRINGIRVQEGSLRPGDELTIGNHRYQVKWSEDSNGPAHTDGAAVVGRIESPLGPALSPDLGSFDEPVALPEPMEQSDKKYQADELEMPAAMDSEGDSSSVSDIIPAPAVQPPNPVA